MSEVENSAIQPIGDDAPSGIQVINDDGVEVIVGDNLPKSTEEHQKLVNQIKGGGDDNTGSPNNNEGSYKYNPMWEIAQKQFEDGFELPEALKTGKLEDKELTPEDEFRLLQESIVKNTKFGFEDDPMVNYYLFAKERNPDIEPMQVIEEYKTSMTIHSMEEDVFLSNYLKANQPDMDEEGIKATIAKLGSDKADIVKKLKNEVLGDFYAQNDSISQQKNEEYEKYMQQFDKRREADVNVLLSGISKDKKVGELQLDDDTFKEFETEFKGTFLRSKDNPLVTINVPQKFVEMLGDDKELMKMVAYHKYGDTMIKKEIERRKAELEEQLGIKPRIDGAAQRASGLIEPI